MKHRVVIYNREHLPIYEGKLLDLPIKMDKIKERSMKVFRDPDPCIIHQSYVIQQMVTPLLSELKKNQEVSFKSMTCEIDWLDLPDLDVCSIILKG